MFTMPCRMHRTLKLKNPCESQPIYHWDCGRNQHHQEVPASIPAGERGHSDPGWRQRIWCLPGHCSSWGLGLFSFWMFLFFCIVSFSLRHHWPPLSHLLMAGSCRRRQSSLRNHCSWRLQWWHQQEGWQLRLRPLQEQKPEPSGVSGLWTVDSGDQGRTEPTIRKGVSGVRPAARQFGCLAIVCKKVCWLRDYQRCSDTVDPDAQRALQSGWRLLVFRWEDWKSPWRRTL